MRRTLRLTLLAILLAVSHSAVASESRSLDDNPWRYMNLDLPLSWSMIRWEAERVNHVLDILSALGDCKCKKAITILENDLRKYQSALKNEVDRINEAESKGKTLTILTLTGTEKQDKLAVTEAKERAVRYWLSRPAK